MNDHRFDDRTDVDTGNGNGTGTGTGTGTVTGGRPLGRLVAVVAVGLLLVALACAWRYTPLHEMLDPRRVLALARRMRELPFAALWTLAAFVIGGLVVVPLIAMIAATGLVWGLVPGVLLALAGSVLSAALTYSIGRLVSGDLVQRHAGPRVQALNSRLSRGGWWAVALIRLLPLAPFSVMNLLFGALRVRALDFIVGTAVGLSPGIVVTVAFANSLTEALHRPGLGSITMLGLAVSLIVALAAGTRRFLARGLSPAHDAATAYSEPVGAEGAALREDAAPNRPRPITTSPFGPPGTSLDPHRPKDS
ncbi:MAG: rane protein [Rhizobacter sp.]|nr:rane protein [Rhizobacter sp.]